MSYVFSPDRMDSPTIVIVGVGGTGSLVADGMCRLLKGTAARLFLVDYDRVEEHNLRRQSFYAGDVGKFKAQVLAERLAGQYGRPIGYSIFPYEKDMFDEEFGTMGIRKAGSLLIIGCTDKAESRQKIAESITRRSVVGNCWVDSGNGYHSGQVLIGNVNKKEELKDSFEINGKEVYWLPSPSLQLPSLLIPPTVPEKPRDCAEAVSDNDQSPTINQAMATLVLDVTWKLLSQKLTYMGAYIDLDVGTLQYVPAAPLTVSRMFGMKVDELMCNKCALGARYHV